MKKMVLMSVATLLCGSFLYANPAAACAGCHGAKGEKNTMAPGSVPNKLSRAEFIETMNGYKAGTLNKYGKGMLMKNFAKTANAEAIADAWGLK